MMRFPCVGSSEIYFEQLDISDAKSIKTFAQNVKEKYKDVTILINNAGSFYVKTLTSNKTPVSGQCLIHDSIAVRVG